MEKNDAAFSLESVKFLIRHPWLFLVPFTVIISISFAYLISAPLLYESQAVLSLQAPASGVVDVKYVQKKKDVISSVLLGDNIRYLMKEVWPQLKEEKDPRFYTSILEYLRSPKGIKIGHGKKGEELIFISFISSKPNLCYKIVQATVDLIIKLDKDEAESNIEAGLTFLKKQLRIYRNKLGAIDEELSRIRTILRAKYYRVNEEERYLIDQALGKISLEDQGQLQIEEKDEKVTELETQLAELQRRRERIQKLLEDRDTFFASEQEVKDDPVLKEYTVVITKKELELAQFLSTGVTSEHPDAIRMQNEIDGLKAMRDKRVEELMTVGTSKSVEEKARLTQQLKMVERDMLAIKKALSGRESLRAMGITEPAQGDLAVQLSSFNELKNERAITQKYYDDLRMQLETTEIKSRAGKGEAGVTVEIVEAPRVPFGPIPFQKTKTLLFGFIISLISGVGLAYVVDMLNNSVESSSQLRQLLQMPVLASIDKIFVPGEIKRRNALRRALVVGLIVFVLTSTVMVKIFLQISTLIK